MVVRFLVERLRAVSSALRPCAPRPKIGVRSRREFFHSFGKLVTGCLAISAARNPLWLLMDRCRAGRCINVQDRPYRAVGDNFTDDTHAIQAALNDAANGSGAEPRAVRLPPGTCRIGRTLNGAPRGGPGGPAGILSMSVLSPLNCERI